MNFNELQATLQNLTNKCFGVKKIEEHLGISIYIVNKLSIFPQKKSHLVTLDNTTKIGYCYSEKIHTSELYYIFLVALRGFFIGELWQADRRNIKKNIVKKCLIFSIFRILLIKKSLVMTKTETKRMFRAVDCICTGQRNKC